MTYEQTNVDERAENTEEESTIKSATVHIGTTIESAQTEKACSLSRRDLGFEAMELPLRLLVLGNFTPNAPPPSDWASASPPISVDKNSFPSVMQQLQPQLSLDVPNRLSGSPQELTVDLSFPDMNAFRPEGIVQQVDGLASLLEIRRLVTQLSDRKLTLQQFGERLQKAGVEKTWLERFHKLLGPPKRKAESSQKRESKPSSDKLDVLLDMVDIGDEQTVSAQEPSEQSVKPSHIDSLIRAIVQPEQGGPKADSSIADAIIDELNQTLNEQINDILHHSEFQQLESTWRGLKFLIDRTDFRENVQVELLSVPKSELRDAIHHQVFTPEYNELTETPLSVMIADYEFDRSPEDMELLGDIARMVASMQVPFVASVGPAFFGLQTAEELSKLPPLRSYIQQPEYAKWNTLRDNEYSQYIALTMPRFLLRFPYGPDGIRVKEFAFTENAELPANHLWGRGAFAVATTLIRSFIDNSWCTQITGLRSGGMVENLPVWSHRFAGRDVSIPLDVLFSQNKEMEFVDGGFILLSSSINDDTASTLAAPTVYRPKKYATPEATKEAQLHATLPYQLFATRMTHYLRRILREVSTGLTAEQMQTAMTEKIRSILSGPGVELPEEAVMVEMSDSEEKPDYYDVVLRIQPPFQILGRDVDLLLGLELHR